MKPCVYCTQPVDDDAIVCRYCTRQVPQKAVTLDYPGRRFGLGRTEDAYAIWDLTSSTPPLSEFQLTTEGWDDAWFRFQQLEKDLAGAVVGVSPGPSSGAPAYPQFPLGPVPPDPSQGRGFTTGAWVCAVLAIVLLPIPFGPAGIVLGAIGNSKGDPRGKIAMYVSIGALIVGLGIQLTCAATNCIGSA